MKKFENDEERKEELKECLEEVLNILTNEVYFASAIDKSRTLIRKVLASYESDKKFEIEHLKKKKLND